MFGRVVVGVAQAAAGVLVGAVRYMAWRTAGRADDYAQAFVHGASSFGYFLFATAWGWLALWLFVEGLLRVLAAAMEQPFSTLPVMIARAAWSLRPAKKLPEDLVEERDDGFVIDSARDYDWHALTTVALDGAHYAVTREPGTPARPHRYRLRPITPDHVIRAVAPYHRK